jgi:hypothetical protein
MGPDKRLLVRLWKITKRPVLTLTLRILYRWLGAERVRFVDDRIDAGYATYRTLAILDVSIESLFPVQLGLGPVPIISTPHFSFVKAHLGHEGERWSKDGWKDYMINESTSDPGSLEPRQERFEKLIDQISDNPHDVHLLVALNPRLRGFEIVDGFHRSAIVAACKPGSTVSCSLVSHIVA